MPGDYKLEDSGNRTQFESGAQRDRPGSKGRFDLLPAKAILLLAKHYEKGIAKYAQRNWELGMPLSQFLDSALRHIFAMMEGKKEEDNAVAAAWNLMCLIQTRELINAGILPKNLDDLPDYTSIEAFKKTVVDPARQETAAKSSPIIKKILKK